MSLTPSTMLELGTHAPNFSLLEPATQSNVSLSNYSDQPLLVAFISNHCPYVILIKEALQRFAKDYDTQGLKVIAINANDPQSYPADSPDKMIEEVQNYGYTFPYLFDETQAVAKQYKAACTPDFFLFDTEHKLYYRGQFDSARPNAGIEVTGIDMRTAADNLLAGISPPKQQIPSVGCSIKWKRGNEPDYT